MERLEEKRKVLEKKNMARAASDDIDGGYAWVILAISCALIALTIGPEYTLGVFVTDWMSHYGVRMCARRGGALGRKK